MTKLSVDVSGRAARGRDTERVYYRHLGTADGMYAVGDAEIELMYAW